MAALARTRIAGSALALVLVLVGVLGGCESGGLDSTTAGRDEAAAPLPALISRGPNPPNLLVIITDDQRATGTLGVMPATRRWFADGRRFSDAYVTTPLCCPSRATIFSGRYAHNHGVWLNNDPHLLDEPQFQTELRSAGYETAIVGKYMNNWPLARAPVGFRDYWTTTGGYNDTKWNENGALRTVATYSTRYIGDLATRFIADAEASDSRPWFLYVAPTAPHGPLEPEPRYADAPVGRFPISPAVRERDLADKPPYVDALTPETKSPHSYPEGVRAGQLRTLISVDDLVGRLRRVIEESGESRRTLVIFTSDNGLMWGEHGGAVLKDLPYPESIRVPLLMRWPGRLGGGIDDRLVANVDFGATLLDAAGLSGARWGDGRSILGDFSRDHLLIEYGGLQSPEIPPWASIVTPDVQMTEYFRGSPTSTDRTFSEFYRTDEDPWELQNLAADRTLPPAAFALRRRLEADRVCRGRSCP